MRAKLNKFTLIAISLLILGLIFADPIKIGICSQYDYDCDTLIGESFASPVALFSFISLIFLVATRWSGLEIVQKWLHFAKYYLPIAAALIFLSPAIDSSILGFDKEFMTWLLSGTFFVVSLGIIVFSARGGSASGGKRHVK